MVKETVFNFHHSMEDFNDALGISKEIDEHCQDIIYFSAMSNHLCGRELFEDIKDIPKQLTTVTGDLEKSISYAKNQTELQYMLLIFRKYHDITLDIISKYEALAFMDGTEKRKFNLMMEQIEITLEEKVKEREGSSFISPKSLFNKIKLVKESRYNFDKYLELVEESKYSVDDRMYKAFGND